MPKIYATIHKASLKDNPLPSCVGYVYNNIRQHNTNDYITVEFEIEPIITPQFRLVGSPKITEGK